MTKNDSDQMGQVFLIFKSPQFLLGKKFNKTKHIIWGKKQTKFYFLIFI